METITFTFPSYDSLWSFKDKSKAINVKISPKMNTISGLFEKHEIEIAVNSFNAQLVENPSSHQRLQK